MTIYYFFIAILVAATLIRFVMASIRKHNARRSLVLAVVTVLICSAVIGHFAIANLNKLRAMRDWPAVTGTVVESRIVGERAIVPFVVYTYELDSNPYRGTSDLGTPAFGNKSKRLNEAETLLADYPVGTRVEVHYNPVDPNVSYIISAVPWNAYAQVGIWLFLSLSSAITLVVFGFRSGGVSK